MITLTINGSKRELDVDPDKPLLWVLRDEAGLIGTKYGCGKALCGACTVHIDGKPMRSCSISAGAVVGREITTIEGLDDDIGHAVQAAWLDIQVPQCGFCQSGQIMAATALLQRVPMPDDDAIDQALQGNICRCATYVRVRKAIKQAAASIEQGATDA